MLPPIWVYYELDGFYQNVRRFVQSRDESQLGGAGVDLLTTQILP